MYQINQTLFFKLYFIVFIALPLIGIFINYSPIPEADFWSIYERIYQLNHNNFSSLWDQHNEHRVVLFYIFAFLDNKYFGGSFYLLYFLTYISMALTGLLFYKIFFNSNQKNLHNNITFGFLLCVLFFWSQKPNFIFPFHVSILWVNLFTLMGLFFYVLYVENKKYKYLFFSTLISIMAFMTIVNGLLAIPLISLFALLKKRFMDCIILFFISTIVFISYFYNFSFIEHKTTLFNLNLRNLFDIYFYFFGYLGSIFSFLFGKGFFGLIIAIIMGHIFLLFSIINFYTFKASHNYSYLTIFLLFILITALLTAYGRFEDGIQHSISSRYTTNSIYGWIALFIIYHEKLKKYFYKSSNKLNIKPVLVIFLLLMMFVQIKAIKIDYSAEKILLRSQELIALTLDIDFSKKRIANLDRFNTKIFMNSQIFNFKDELFLPFENIKFKNKDINIIKLDKLKNLLIESDSNKLYSKITFNLDMENIKKVYFIDNNEEITGYAISQNNFKFISSKKNRFMGISKGIDSATHIMF